MRLVLVCVVGGVSLGVMLVLAIGGRRNPPPDTQGWTPFEAALGRQLWKRDEPSQPEHPGSTPPFADDILPRA